MEVALTREHPIVIGGETSGVTNALQCPQDMVVCIGPIRSMMDAGADVVPVCVLFQVKRERVVYWYSIQ